MSKPDEMPPPPTGRAAPRQGVRRIRLRHFSSGNVVETYDDGCDDRGMPNQQRQHLINTLKKRLRFAGVEVPTFRLHEPPSPWPQPRSEREAAIRAADQFDSLMLKDDTGGWRTPSEKWEELSRQAIATEAARVEQLRSQTRNERGARALEALERLQNLAAQVPAPSSAAKPSKKGEAA